ncbi:MULTISPECIES: ABC transporter permease [Idiomarina]|uniref:ABC transporter permease n=1 Tax=Idiomarina TaxID=135575 RepID=UPI00129CF557|nr:MULTISPECIES: ABC transporter permease [Idiomarina]MRJ42209.1 ABC transporter permease [Idiomarina sp. FeN1]NCU57135.1 ABC transporter permease [Idiomarina sp. FenA--70]NCU59844.1 ABC transporter permease [Idiomarina sp. FenBw--71]UUN13166.1 ABC transporter permease [Idiomarina loihiensis]
MNRWQHILRIGGFEFRRFFKWKQEVFSLVLMGVLFAISIGWGQLKVALEETHQVAVVAPLTMPELENITWVPASNTSKAMTELGTTYAGVLTITADAEQGYLAELAVLSNAGWQDRMSQAISSYLQQQKLNDLALNEEQIAFLNQPPSFVVAVQNQDRARSSANKALPTLILVSIMVAVFGSFGLMMTAITQEKQQRVTEQLLTLITPSQWMDGKILGITLHCLKSMATILILIVLVVLVMSVVAGDAMTYPEVSWQLFVATTLFALLGLAMINAMMAGFAATIDDPNHSGRSAMMLIPALFVGAGFGVMDTPQGLLAQILSWFPLTSFAVMPIRVADGGVAWWEWSGSLVVLFLTTYIIRSAAVRLFTLGITMYGKEPSWRSMGRALIGR